MSVHSASSGLFCGIHVFPLHNKKPIKSCGKVFITGSIYKVFICFVITDIKQSSASLNRWTKLIYKISSKEKLGSLKDKIISGNCFKHKTKKNEERGTMTFLVIALRVSILLLEVALELAF